MINKSDCPNNLMQNNIINKHLTNILLSQSLNLFGSRSSSAQIHYLSRNRADKNVICNISQAGRVAIKSACRGQCYKERYHGYEEKSCSNLLWFRAGENFLTALLIPTAFCWIFITELWDKFLRFFSKMGN